MSSYDLNSPGTAWVFISDSDEPRHLHDIVYAIHVLRDRGVPDDDIGVFTDHFAAASYFQPFGFSNICPLDDLAGDLSLITGYTSVVVVVTGHGRADGIGTSRRTITPYGLLAAVRAVPGLDVGVLVLCQCFAGIFDRLDARSAPELVLLGATNLNESLSRRVALPKPIVDANGAPALDGWVANIFAFDFFAWIGLPSDVDGDGALTIMDAYKFAGARSNQRLLRLKSELYLDALQLAESLKWLAVKRSAEDPFSTTRLKLQLDAVRVQLQQTLEMLYLHQEPWILNADLARRISI